MYLYFDDTGDRGIARLMALQGARIAVSAQKLLVTSDNTCGVNQWVRRGEIAVRNLSIKLN